MHLFVPHAAVAAAGGAAPPDPARRLRRQVGIALVSGLRRAVALVGQDLRGLLISCEQALIQTLT